MLGWLAWRQASYRSPTGRVAGRSTKSQMVGAIPRAKPSPKMRMGILPEVRRKNHVTHVEATAPGGGVRPGPSHARAGHVQSPLGQQTASAACDTSNGRLQVTITDNNTDNFIPVNGSRIRITPNPDTRHQPIEHHRRHQPRHERCRWCDPGQRLRFETYDAHAA